jgi:RHS repeat-associated protein
MTYNDYYPFGSLIPTRHESSEGYRYGFQCPSREERYGRQEKDNPPTSLGTSEIKGEGNSINYKYRMHDTRVGRFFAVDPLAAKYPELSVFQFSSNNPISLIELEGLEGVKRTEYDENGNVIRHVVKIKIVVLTVDDIDKQYKKEYIKKFGRKAWRKLERNRVRSDYTSNDVNEIKSILNNGFKNKLNSKGERVDFEFDVKEMHIDSKNMLTNRELKTKARYELGLESSEKYDKPMQYKKGKFLKYKMSPLNVIMRRYNPENARGYNNGVFSMISDEDDKLDETVILHETAHQLLTRGKNEEHKIISQYDIRIDKKTIDAILEDAYEDKK